MTEQQNSSADIEDAELDRINAWIASIGRITPKIRQRILDLVGRLDKCRDSRPLVYALSHNDPITVGDIRSIAIALEDDIGAVAQPSGLRECLQSIADADDSEPREPDDADWRFRFLEAQRAARCALAAHPSLSAGSVKAIIDEADIFARHDAHNSLAAHLAKHWLAIRTALTATQPQAVQVIGDDALWALASTLHSNVDRLRLAAKAFLGKYTDSRTAPLAKPSAADSPEVWSSTPRGTSSVSRPNRESGK
jgi:hypothetical protein